MAGFEVSVERLRLMPVYAETAFGLCRENSDSWRPKVRVTAKQEVFSSLLVLDFFRPLQVRRLP
jgi:hypothetical protein